MEREVIENGRRIILSGRKNKKTACE